MFDLVPFRKNKNGSLSNIEDSFNSLMSNFFNDFMNENEFAFKTDIREEKDKYWIEAELPGLNKEDIQIEVNDNRLNITASRNEMVEEKKDNYIYKERKTGKFQRSFLLDNVKEDEIEAEYDNGILKLMLPKEVSNSNKKKIINIK
ncbi:MAG: Hsp20/alpha crystallin family protein [bacterium]